jgi:hypothetical protein
MRCRLLTCGTTSADLLRGSLRSHLRMTGLAYWFGTNGPGAASAAEKMTAGRIQIEYVPPKNALRHAEMGADELQAPRVAHARAEGAIGRHLRVRGYPSLPRCWLWSPRGARLAAFDKAKRQLRRPERKSLIPRDPHARLETRLLDRLCTTKGRCLAQATRRSGVWQERAGSCQTGGCHPGTFQPPWSKSNMSNRSPTAGMLRGT